MKTPILTSSRSSPAINGPADAAMDPNQKRIRVMMLRAADLANVALALEKDRCWSQAVEAYGEVCDYFKKMLEFADSKDLQDLLYVYQKYSKRQAFLKVKAAESSTDVSSGSSLKSHKKIPPLNSPENSRPGSGSQLNASKYGELSTFSPVPRTSRNRSDSYTTPSNSSPLSSIRRPSLATLSSVPSKPSLSKSKLNISQSSMATAVLLLQSDLKLCSLNDKHNSKGTAEKRTENNSIYSSSEFESINCSVSSQTSSGQMPQDSSEPRRALDLNSIPEMEENSLSFRGTSHIPRLRSRPRLTHNPSMPNIGSSFSAQGLNKSTITTPKTYSTFETALPHSNWRDSFVLSDDWDYSPESQEMASSIASGTSYIFAGVKPRSNGVRKPSWVVKSTSELSTTAASRLSSHIQDSSVESSPRLSLASLATTRSDDTSGTSPPGPSPMIRAHTVPEPPQLTIHTDLPIRLASDLLSPDAMNSPGSALSTEFPASVAPKYNLSLFQTLWDEEILTKQSWKPPPSSGLLRSFWFMSCLKQSMTVGGFVGSKRIFISPAVWRQSGLRLAAVEVKMQALICLEEFLIRLREHWQEDVLGIRKGLEELEVLANNMQQTLAAKLDFVPPLKKNQNSAATAFLSIANKISKSVERFQADVILS